MRTLDGSNGTNTPLDCDLNMDGFSHCSWGVIGAKGFAVIDDTGAPAFDAPSPDTDWPWLRSRPNEPVNEGLCTADLSLRRQCGFNGIMWDECGRRGCCYRNSTADEGAPFCFYSEQASLDLMFFGHGLNFKQALLEFTQIAGKIPVPPRYLFGVYFSRYWAYADYEEYGLVQDYVDHQLPLDILVTDMDWSVGHTRHSGVSPGGCSNRAGWLTILLALRRRSRVVLLIGPGTIRFTVRPTRAFWTKLASKSAGRVSRSISTCSRITQSSSCGARRTTCATP